MFFINTMATCVHILQKYLSLRPSNECNFLNNNRVSFNLSKLSFILRKILTKYLSKFFFITKIVKLFWDTAERIQLNVTYY